MRIFSIAKDSHFFFQQKCACSCNCNAMIKDFHSFAQLGPENNGPVQQPYSIIHVSIGSLRSERIS